MLSIQELFEILKDDLTTEEIQAIRVALGMNPQSDVIEAKTGEARVEKVEDSLVTHWDIIENQK